MKSARVGRGGRRGKTSGRGTKGQKARAGRKLRPELRDIIKKIPKLRGRGKNFLRSIKEPSLPVNLSLLEANFTSGDTVTPEIIVKTGVVRTRKAEIPVMKILGDGEITKKLTLKGFSASKSAREKIEKAGGTIN